MAEGFSRTIQAGSDADIEVPCTLCEEDGVRKGAVNYCPTCDQYFCTVCSKYHARFPSTKGHTVSDIHSKDKHATRVVRATDVAKCPVHPDRIIEMYCGQHNMVYCALCVATDHRTCSGVKEVTDTTEPKMNPSEVQSLVGKIDILHTKLQDSKKRKQRNIEQLDSKEKELVEEIKAAHKVLVQHIDKLQETAFISLNNTRQEVITQIKTEIAQAIDMETTLQKCRGQISSLNSLSNNQKFIQQVLGQRTVAEAGSLLSGLDIYGSKKVELDVNKNLHDLVLNTKYIVQPREETIKLEGRLEDLPKVKNITDINVEVPDDISYTMCNITGITQLPDGTILICDNSNKKLKRLDDNWKVRDYCILDCFPWGVCCTGDNEVAVKMSANTIQFVSVGTTLSKTRSIKISDVRSLGIECIFGQLWVSQSGGINVYSLSGSLVKNNLKLSGIEFNSCPKEIFFSGSGETVYVSGCENQIACLDKEGSLKAIFEDKRLKSARGVCVLNDNIVCAAGYDSNNIVMFRKDGKCLGELVGASQGIKKPRSLCYDKRGSKVIVASYNSDTLKVLSFE